MIDAQLAEKIKKDYVVFSGGYTPDLSEHEMNLYIEHHSYPGSDPSDTELEAFFEAWIVNIENGTEPSQG